MKNQEKIEIFNKNDLLLGRMICSCKSYYRTKNPGNLVIFNANVIGEKSGKIWYGDLDITKDGKNLKKVSEELNERLYVLREMDARFGTENEQLDKLIKLAVWNSSL